MIGVGLVEVSTKMMFMIYLSILDIMRFVF